MRIGCSRCQTQYDLPDEKLERGAAKIRCTKCGHVFVVRRRAAPPPPADLRPDEAQPDRAAPPPSASPEPSVPPPPPEPPEPETGGDLFGDLGAPAVGAPPPHPLPDANAKAEDLGDLGLDLGGAPPPAGQGLPDANREEELLDELGAPSPEERPEEPAAPPAEEPSVAPGRDFDLGSLDLAEAAGGPEEGPAASAPVAEPEPPAPTPAEAAAGTPRAGLDDFDFDSFIEPHVPSETPAPAAQAPGRRDGERHEDDFGNLDDLPSLGELDLGEFEEGHGPGLEEPPMPLVGRGSAEPRERVRPEDLVSPTITVGEPKARAGAEGPPRVEAQQGLRKAAAPSPVQARDRRRSPLFWVVIAAVLATGGYTAYNAFLNPQAFNFLNPSWIGGLLHQREVAAKFGTEDLKGYWQDLAGGRRVFVIRGKVVNKSGVAQGLIRVRANAFGRGGGTLGTSEVYCGNVLTERELSVLPWTSIEARLQNQVGEALANVDVPAGGRVPFMVVFTALPGRLESYNVVVSAWRGGS